MSTRHTTTEDACTKCGNPISIDASYEAGGCNDYGGVIVECGKCKAKNHVYVGRDIDTASITKGGRIIDTYVEDLGNKSEVLKRHGL